MPKERFNIDAFWSEKKNRGATRAKGAHFLKQDISEFDANFFTLPKNDVEATDPQQRIMMEVAYEALERAGLPLDKIAGTRTGVFMGSFTSDYREGMIRDPDNLPANTATASPTTALSARISWLWDLQGPCFTLDTACSSSLVALHLACQSLRTGESDYAIVGGTSLLLNPEWFTSLSNQGFISPDGKCKSFDESGDGYGRGEGFGCVILKRVDDAVSAGDPIRAVIRGSGSNQDGHTKGFTVPSADAQARLITDVYRGAGLDFNDTSYIEAHGTGTQAGDFQETTALARTIASTHTSKNKLIIGSVKSNIGHLEAAAGIAGIIKAILTVESGMIPPSINFKKGNPKIKFDEWNLQVARQLTPWPTDGVRRVSTNSFGYGGTNAHAIVDDAASYLQGRGITTSPHITPEDRSRPRLFVLSAQDREGLKRVKEPLAKYAVDKGAKLESDNKGTNEFLSQLAYTLSDRRSQLQWKTYAVASSPDQLAETLNDDENPALVAQSSRQPRIGFVFTGQGAQWPRMGMELMAYPVFRDRVHEADRYLQEVCEWPRSAVEELEKGKSSSQLHLAEFSQTLCTVLQVALVDLLRTWGIVPTAVAGHSSGEIGAAYAMGALSKEDAWRVAYYRGILSTKMKTKSPHLKGSMMAASLSPEKAAEWIAKVTEGELVVACVNSPTTVTISGDTTGIEQLLEMLQKEDIFARKLQVDTAYHSPHMQTVASDYYRLLADLVPLDPTGDCTMHSSVEGSIIEPEQLGALNWVRNLVSPVQFADAMYDMLRPVRDGKRADENAVDLLVELGPHSALQGPTTQTLKARNITNIPYQSVVSRNQNAVGTALNLAGALWAQGYEVDIKQVNGDASNQFAAPLFDLPTYPWKHAQRYYNDSRVENEFLHRPRPKQSLIGAPAPAMGEGEYIWRGFIRLAEEPWIGDHQIQGTVLYPAAGYLAMALEAITQIADTSKQISYFRLRDIQLTAAAIISADADVECIVQLRPHLASTRDSSSTWTEFTVTSSPDGKTLVKNCSGLLIVEHEPAPGSEAGQEKALKLRSLTDHYVEAKASCTSQIDSEEFYNDLDTIGLQYGPTFANVREVRNGNGKSYGVVEIPDVPASIPEGCDRPHLIHPGTLDAIFHLAFAAIMGDDPLTAMVPKSIDEVIVSAYIPWAPGVKLPGFATSAKHGFRELKSDITMLDDNEHLPAVNIRGFLCAEVAGGSAGNTQALPKSITSELVWRPAIDLLPADELQRALAPYKGTQKVAEYVKLLHHSNPALSVLEIANDSSLLASGDLSNILSTGEVTITWRDAELKTKLDESAPDAIIESLDFTEELSSESLKERNYDVVILSDLSSFDSHTETILSNIAKVLKPGGKVCFDADKNAVAKVQSRSYAKEIRTKVFHSAEHSYVIGQKSLPSDSSNGTSGHADPDRITLIQPAKLSNRARAVASDVSTTLQDDGYEIDTFSWGSDVSTLAGKTCISLLELQESILQDLGESDFENIKETLLNSAGVFWVTAFDDPSSSMIDGLTRVVRNETPGLSLRTFHAGGASLSSTPRLAKLISIAFNSESEEDEYSVKDDLLHVSRIEENVALNDQINDLLPGTARNITDMPLKDLQFGVKMSIQTPGMLDSICMVLDESAGTVLEPEYVEIQVKASSINFRDVMAAMGQLPDSKLGLDAAGIVRRIGSDVTNFKVGDRVAVYGHGSHRTIHRTREELCALIPEGMTFEQAASVPAVHGTAWNALVRLAKVQKGQSVLIHAAAGGVGQAAIQIARHFEMEIFATVSSDTKRELLRSTYGIPDDHIFNSRGLDFGKGIKRMTEGRGVDVVLNSLAGEALRQTWHCIAPFGYFIEIGLRDILANTGLDMYPFKQDATFSFFNLNHLEESTPETLATIVEGAFDYFRRGISKPIEPLVSHPISEVESALRQMQAGKYLGKQVFTWGDDDVVPVVQPPRSTLQLDPEGVYVLSGGLGGLGRSLSMKLVELGARKICFLSRSGAKSAGAKELVHDLEHLNVQVQALVCDVANDSAVAASIAKCTKELGTIRGVFQCAMVLRDTLFVNMSHQQWLEATRPKVQGSWNLSKRLPNVDFFVSLSSFAAVYGNRGQTNYGAAGAYEDALAHHRRAQGLRATTVDLGIMRDIGVLAETGITETLRDWEKPYGIREPEFHALMERAIEGDIQGTGGPQVMTGLATGGSAVAAGIDPPFYLDSKRFSVMALTGMRNQSAGGAASDSTSAPTHTLIAAAESLEEAATAVTNALVKQVAKMLQMPVEEIDTERFLHSYGIDSLVAIELMNWALKEFKTTVTVFDVLAGVPISIFAAKLAAKSTVLPKALVPS
ncbi:Type I Iterative PKS [Bacidia gigantensis]|uniref:Type I Iterative PKS n=1 Tax=Bacidia gigantensis TaxID=2732470 RepID=UPI001D03D66C|nr:Type I Iterative PKS [Bacidia gigantensis]KAG8527705.1 Type I Iterative PKS [Bacidia gigantensis]